MTAFLMFNLVFFFVNCAWFLHLRKLVQAKIREEAEEKLFLARFTESFRKGYEEQYAKRVPESDLFLGNAGNDLTTENQSLWLPGEK